jgi:predicted NACHT family NTPase
MGDPIVDSAGAKKTGVKINEQWTKLQWKALESAYKKRLLAEHSTTKLLGNPKEIRIDQVYTDVFVLDQVSASRRLDLEELKKERLGSANQLVNYKRVPLLDVVSLSSVIFLLGKPGAGKSTFLKTLVRRCCDGSIDKTAIFVSLKRWSDSGETLMEFIVSEFSICNFPDANLFVTELLERGGAFVLFDGLDEVPNTSEKRLRAIAAVADFTRRFHQSKIILTCRTAATEYSFDKFTYLEIADFTLEQQKSFISKWYSDKPDVSKSLLNEWGASSNSGLVELAKTPLLLALLCLAYDETLVFPKRRVELYEESINALLRKWDASRQISRDDLYREISHNRKEQMLRRLAFQTFKDADILIPKTRLIKLIKEFLDELPSENSKFEFDGEVVLRAMEAQHGLIVERAVGVYSFSHLTVQEYFTARKIVESTKTEEIIAIMRENAPDDQWREVILMVASMLDDGRFLIDSFFEILEELCVKEPRISKFIQASLADMQSSRQSLNGFIPSRPVQTISVDSNAKLLIECCLSISLNMRLLGVGGDVLLLPQLLAGSLRGNPRIISNVFGADEVGLANLKSYFRLAVLSTECLLLAALPERKNYVKKIFLSSRPKP